ncbi:unnamed protein product [Brassica oleracea var. botrytis]
MSCGEDWRKEARHSPLAMAFHGDRIAYQPLKRCSEVRRSTLVPRLALGS